MIGVAVPEDSERLLFSGHAQPVCHRDSPRRRRRRDEFATGADHSNGTA
jgi:hypothetical protein